VTTQFVSAELISECRHVFVGAAGPIDHPRTRERAGSSIGGQTFAVRTSRSVRAPQTLPFLPLLTLYDRYKFILDRIQKQTDEQQRIRARHILGWLAFACRPLKVWEVCSGIVFHNEDGNLDDESKLGKGILDICKPLIEERDGEIVTLVHFSARELVTPSTFISSSF
jgi:hypothetical protein